MSNSIRRRTRARELALQFLYSLEMQGGTAMEDLQSFLDHHLKIAEDAQEGDQADRDQVAEYAKGICLGVHAKLSELNRWITVESRRRIRGLVHRAYCASRAQRKVAYMYG